MFELRTLLLFLVTAVAEIIGCYLPYLWLKHDKSAWLLVPAALSLALFAWLLSLHPTAAGLVLQRQPQAAIFRSQAQIARLRHKGDLTAHSGRGR